MGRRKTAVFMADKEPPKKPDTSETPTGHMYIEIESAAVIFSRKAAAHAGNSQQLNFSTADRAEGGYYDPHK